jgi:hypothetical protein
MAKHGTYTRSQKHINDRDPLCDPCRKARNKYAREWMRKRRAASPEQRAKDRAHSLAYSQASKELRKRHPDEFAELLAAAKRGGS